VTEFMSRYWGKKNPNIVLSVISSEEGYKPWKSQRLKDDFQKGILKVLFTLKRHSAFMFSIRKTIPCCFKLSILVILSLKNASYHC
jgi:hypothetical protein